MKKLLYLLLLMPMFFMASCSDDDDLPAVDLKIEFSGVTSYDNTLYTVKGDTVTVKRISATALNGKPAGVTNVTYYLDGLPLLYTNLAPYSAQLNTEDLPVGLHAISMSFNILEVDKSISSAITTYRLNIVQSVDDIPQGADPIGTVISNATLSPKK